jgi:hypothetical protein
MVGLLSLSALMACSDDGNEDEDDSGSAKSFAACCAAGSECESGLCHSGHGACTLPCDSDSDCPPEPKNGEPSCKDGLCQAERDGDVCAER